MKLQAQKREKTGSNNSRALRKAGRVPAVLYGSGDPLHVSLAGEDVQQLIKSRERVIDLDVDGANERVLFKHAQFDTFGLELIHIDFYRVTDSTVVRVRIPLEFKGTPIGLMQAGIVEYARIELLVEGPAGKLPTVIVVPVDDLNLAQIIHVDEVQLPDGIRPSPTLDPRGEVVACRVAKKKAEKATEEELEEGLEPGVEGAAAEAAPAAAAG